jgi:HEPN domain-containing protein
MTDPKVIALTRRWMHYAETDLLAAERLLNQPDIAPHVACFHAQQAAEKALKAALVFEQIEPPRTHNLDAVRDCLPPAWRVHANHPSLGRLTAWAVESRYPGMAPEATVTQARDAVAQARAVVRSIRADLAVRGIATPQST